MKLKFEADLDYQTAAVDAEGRLPEAKVEIDIQGAGEVCVERLVSDGDDLAELTGRDIYRNVTIA